jgi:(4-(4-[2-(gamma-L-glutamylamino)ethyl]phenoxymethyl)furan-2-yl)methanamine synthase
LAKVIGLDVGGANTKAVFLKTKKGEVEEIRMRAEYFPVWNHPEKLVNVISTIIKALSVKVTLDGVGVTMTAELSDAYQTKREGVTHIVSCVLEAFPDLPVFVLDVDANLKSPEAAKAEPLKVAAANWAATGWLVAQKIKTCVIVDVGSTSTSIIPVINGRVWAIGKNDLEKLMVGELVYTGSLRTNVATIVQSVPLRGSTVRVASELFAQSGDVHLVLGNISEAEYVTDTADGRGKTRNEALARLARVVCGDIEMLTEKELRQIAKYCYRSQVEQVAEGLRQVYSRVKGAVTAKVPVVVTGVGKNFVARAAAQILGVDEIIDLSKLCLVDAFVYQLREKLQTYVGIASPAVGVALMLANKFEEEQLNWTQ